MKKTKPSKDRTRYFFDFESDLKRITTLEDNFYWSQSPNPVIPSKYQYQTKLVFSMPIMWRKIIKCVREFNI